MPSLLRGQKLSRPPIWMMREKPSCDVIAPVVVFAEGVVNVAEVKLGVP